MKNLKFPNGWFNQATFKRENGFLPGCQKNLLKNLSRNGSVEVRVTPRGTKLVRLYRQIQQPEVTRGETFPTVFIRDMFSFMGMTEMPALTNEI